MAKKSKGGRVTVPKARTYFDVAPPADTPEFWVWYRKMQSHPVAIRRPRPR